MAAPMRENQSNYFVNVNELFSEQTCNAKSQPRGTNNTENLGLGALSRSSSSALRMGVVFLSLEGLTFRKVFKSQNDKARSCLQRVVLQIQDRELKPLNYTSISLTLDSIPCLSMSSLHLPTR